MATKIKVTGMSCQHCVNHVGKALESLKDIENVKVNLNTSEATFDNPSSVGMDEIVKAIEDAGYGVG